MLDPRNEPDCNPRHTSDPFRIINDRNDSWSSGSFGGRARKTGENYKNYLNLSTDGVQLRPQNSEDESGVQSPPLWKSSTPRSQSNPRYNPNTYRSLSPTSRTQAIARGQRELMEMVKNMPESCYELSLKDLVEHPRIESPKEESCLLEEKNYEDKHQVLDQKVKSVRRQESKNNNSEKKAQILRSGSMENRDLFLKMVFPVSFKSKKKKNLMTNTFAKVSPKPEGSDKTSKSVDKDWWKKRFSSSSGSDSGRTSSNGGSTRSSGSSSSSSRSNSGRKKRGFLTSCFSCFYPTKSKSAE